MTPDEMVAMSTTPDSRARAQRAGVTPKELAATVMIVKTIADAIKEICEARDGSVPSGEFYVRLQGAVTLNTYNRVIDFLKKAKLITVSNNLITWVG